MIRIYTVWATRPHAPEEPELLTAWDEFSVDNNPEGFEDDWRKAVTAMGSDLGEVRHITISVSRASVVSAFHHPVIEGFTV